MGKARRSTFRSETSSAQRPEREEDLPRPLQPWVPPSALVELICERLRVMGEPTRLKLLYQLRDRGASVQELSRRLGTSQQNTSKHLRLLHRTGVVERRKRGTHVRYTLADAMVLDVSAQIAAAVWRHHGELRDLASHGSG